MVRTQTIAFMTVAMMLLVTIYWIAWASTADRVCSAIFTAIIAATLAPLLGGANPRRRGGSAR